MADDGSTQSFDPRSWVRPAAGPIPAPPEPAPPPVAGRRRPPLLAIGGAAALIAVGGGAAWLSRDPSVAGTATTATAEPAAGPTPAQAGTMRRTLVLSGPGDLKAALVSSGITVAVADAAVAATAGALKPGEIRAVITLVPGEAGPTLTKLEASNPDSSGVVVSADGQGGFTASRIAANLTSRVIVKRGTMDADSFYSSAVAAGITDSLIPDFAQALAFDFDFQREVHKGDVFEAAFEQETDPNGSPVGPPKLLYASLTTADKSAAVYRFAPPGEAAGWFDASGRSIVRALLRTPVEAARVSSSFGFRIHPILGFAKLHKGTDFAAPIGTPIFASGDAQVEFAGPKGPNGNFVKLRHDNGWETLYLHMNRFGDRIATGVRVAQGQRIGEVGTTGRSTGPHLHYELHIDGEPVDPMSVKTESGKTLSGPALEAFTKERDRIDVSRTREAS
ncbi:M23 family metallopeptidase [Sphingomonas sp. Leaf343]|uniref:M23 family metallopeptidase n=1 Tax=Sphingomonas sp. Leaf343 TaxID=1736345 RepID=UPI0006F45DBC|nr:peptidoglycan DD-metalloendopeptidase family protein [Sphingomonas sp. Leaf343]KQR81245.1 hypothetical protein ASG07_12350 [Sphingomonas sp. Leaf343]